MVAVPTLSNLTARQCRRALQRVEAKRLRQITAATPHRCIDEQLMPFGGTFALEKLLGALAVEQALAEHFLAPARTPELGDWRIMVKGLLVSRLPWLHRAAKITSQRERVKVKHSEPLVVKPTWEYLRTRIDEVRAHREVWQEAALPLVRNMLLRPREHDHRVHRILCTAEFAPRPGKNDGGGHFAR